LRCPTHLYLPALLLVLHGWTLGQVGMGSIIVTQLSDPVNLLLYVDV
jgi:hypothetical protein